MEKQSEIETLATEEDIKNLSDGLINLYQEPLMKVAGSLKELTNKQRSLIDSVEVQKLKLQTSQGSDVVQLLFADVATCRERLVLIKKQMMSIHERTTKLKIRSQNVLKHANSRYDERVQELEREQRLIGAQSSSHSS